MFKSTDLSAAFLEFLVARSLITEAAAHSVLTEQRQRTPQIGRIALKQGLMNADDVRRILALQRETRLRFGEQAIALGLINDDQLKSLLKRQWDVRPGVGELLIEMGCAPAEVLSAQRTAFMDEVADLIA